MAKAKEYIAYQGDRPLGTGTVKELAEGLGYAYSTLPFNASPSAHKRSGVAAELSFCMRLRKTRRTSREGY